MKRVLIVLFTALLLCFLATATAGAQLTGFIDVANDGNNNTAIAYPTGTLTVSGWAADLNPVVAPVTSVQVFIDGTLIGNAKLNQARTDVANAFNNQALLSSGWTLSVPVKSLTVGQHTITAFASDPYSLNVNLNPSSSNCCVITVAEADLIESVPVVTGSLVSGGSIQIQETTSDAAPVGAGVSWTRIYLNTSNAKGGTLLATRSISGLGAGGSSPYTSKVTLPLNLSGNYYYVVACANDTGSVVESNSSNNCNGGQILVTAADLTVTALGFPTVAATGTTIQATETTANSPGSTSTTWTRFYLNKTAPTKTGGTLVGTQTVPALTPTAATYIGATNINVPSNITAGQYFLVACANDTGSAVESNYGNNCTAQSLKVVSGAGPGTAIVDAINGTDASLACSTAVPCKTITHALSISPAFAVVLAKPGTYSEQVVIQHDVTLTSTSPYAAVIQPPATLTGDPTNTTPSTYSLVFVGSPASTVAISNMTIQGAGSSNCGLNQGIYVTAGTQITITGNKVLTIGDPTCGYSLAIRFGNSALNYAAAGVISNNVVSAYVLRGIIVDGSNANVTGNTVTGPAVNPSYSPAGIVIRSGAQSVVSGNTVTQNVAGTLCAHADGIMLFGLSGNVTVSNNSVTANDEGIGIYTFPPSSGATNISILSNTVYNNNFLGIHIDGNSGGNTVERNTIYGNGQYDEVDETGSWTSPNNWGTDPSNYNILGNGGPYTQLPGSLACPWN